MAIIWKEDKDGKVTKEIAYYYCDTCGLERSADCLPGNDWISMICNHGRFEENRYDACCAECCIDILRNM